jgi:hypothetical protein
MAHDTADDSANHDAPDTSVSAIGTIIPLYPAAMPAMGTLFQTFDRILKAPRPDDMDEVLAERQRMIALLTAFAVFMGRSWGDPLRFEAIRLLRDFSVILDQLGDGVHHPFVTAALKKGNRQVRLDVWGARVAVCAALQCLIRHSSDTRETTAWDIAGKCPVLKRLIRGMTETSAKSREQLRDAILSWDDRLLQGNAHEFVVLSWENVLHDLAKPGAPFLALSRMYLEIGREAAEKIALPSGA